MRLALPVLAVAIVCFAAAPVAKVSSSGDFRLRGATVRTAGVPSWPVMAGDEIATGAHPAIISFRDGSRLTLGRASRARLASENGALSFRLLDGVLDYRLASRSALRVFNQSTPLNDPNGIAATSPMSPNQIQSQLNPTPAPTTEAIKLPKISRGR